MPDHLASFQARLETLPDYERVWLHQVLTGQGPELEAALALHYLRAPHAEETLDHLVI